MPCRSPFRSSNPGRDLLLFRGTAPLLQPEDLLRSVSATQLDPGTTRYLMPALSGVDYWFAVLDAGLYKVGQAPLEKGVNTSDAPVQVPVGSGRISLAPPSLVRRALPLPSLQISTGVQTGVPLGSGSTPDFPAESRSPRPRPIPSPCSAPSCRSPSSGSPGPRS